MPNYDFHCDACDFDFERICRIADGDSQTCPSCDGPVRRFLGGAPRIIGSSCSTALDFGKQLGERFSTPSALAAYEEKEGVSVLSKSDPKFRHSQDKRRNRMDARAKKAGYNDHDHRIRTILAERAKKKALDGK